MNAQIVSIKCPSCKHHSRLPEILLGKKVPCKKCGKVFVAQKEPEKKALSMIKLAIQYHLLTAETSKKVLSVYQSEKQKFKTISIENILVKNGFMTKKQLDLLKALRRFWEIREDDTKLSKIIKAENLIKDQDIEMALAFQAKEFKESMTCRSLLDILVSQKKISVEKQKELQRLKEDPSEKGPPRQTQEKIQEELPQAKEETPPEIEHDEGIDDVGSQLEDEGFELSVTDDNMKCYIKPKGAPTIKYSTDDIKKLLADQGICYGIVDDSMIGVFARHEKIQKKEPFKIAMGKSAQKGQSATIKYFFEVEHLKAGAIKEGGTIDFSDRGVIPHIEKGGVLAQKTPMTIGVDGIDIYHNPITVKPTEDISLFTGEGATISEDGLQVIAKTEGQPKVTLGGKFSVLSNLNVDGDIGLKTGHINFEGNVISSGVVQSGFKVKCGNIDVKEILDASIEATGDVTVFGGIIGAEITAKGTIRAKYIKDAKIFAFGDVIVGKEIIDSTIEASGTVHIERGKIVSSEVSAQAGIIALDIGTEISKPCIFRVGTKEQIKRELDGIKAAIQRRQKSLEELLSRKQEIVDKEQSAHQEIAEMAQIQDRSTLVKNQLLEEVKGYQSKGSNEGVAKIENQIKELDEKAASAEKRLDELFDIQDQLVEEKEQVEDNLKQLALGIDELEAERKALFELSKKERKKPVIEVRGTLFAGTHIHGVNISKVFAKTVKNIKIQEIQNTDPDAASEWELKYWTER